jgi:hypothetical protein
VQALPALQAEQALQHIGKLSLDYLDPNQFAIILTSFLFSSPLQSTSCKNGGGIFNQSLRQN